jgi:hypothetical protein
MDLTSACNRILSQLLDMVSRISERDFSSPCESLSNSTIGQHLRHTLEFFICFQQGFETGTINYDKRSHDRIIETDKFVALATINKIIDFVNSLRYNKALKLEVGYDVSSNEFVTIDTNATRELVYNIEHAVHHMAIMKIGIRERAPYISLPPDFGIAASTIRHHEAATR